MITPQKLRPRLLPLVLGSALLAVAATGNAEEMNSGQTNSPDILLGPLSTMSRAPNSSPIKKPLPMPYRKAIP